MCSDKVQQWVRPEIRALSAYHVPPARGMVKLDAMENPYSWPDALKQPLLDELATAAINRYPDPNSSELKQVLRTAMAVPPGMDVVLGNGSDELIQMIAMTLAGPERVVLAPEPTFVMYRMIAAFTGMQFVGVPLCDDFGLDAAAMLRAVDAHQPAVIFLAYPNNPTGNLFARADIDAIIARAPGLVVIDEAYHAFAGASYMSELGRADNVVVMRTVSKLGLAGLRLGVLAGPSAWLNEFEKVRLPYNINVLTQTAATFALRHADVFARQTAAICAARTELLAALARIPGVRPYPSHANFVLFRVPPGRANPVFEALKQRGVLIKNLHRDDSPLADCLRVTVGTPDENRRFLDALAAAMQ